MNEQLTDDNFILYAAKHYDNPSCLTMEEFSNDIKKIRYIKRHLNKYKQTGILKERFILNHIIIVSNLFGREASIKMLFFKIEKEFWSELKTFLSFLNLMPDRISGVNEDGSDIISSSIPMNINIMLTLRKI